MRKVKTILDPELASLGTDRMRSIVEVELGDGRVLSRVADTARGTPEKPLKDAELNNKFRECASFVLEENRIDLVLKTIQRIEEISNVKELTALLTTT